MTTEQRPSGVGASRLLVVVAAPAEAGAVIHAFGGDAGQTPVSGGAWAVRPLAAGVDLLMTGVGKANAAGGTAWVLATAGGRYAWVLNAGIGGTLDADQIPIGRTVLASRSVYGDEGIGLPGDDVDGRAFQSCRQMGFPLGPFEGDGVPCDPAWGRVLGGVAEAEGVVATVSTCSGTDVLAGAVRARTGAVVEAMEGAAVRHAVAGVAAAEGREIRFAELRVVSNTTGDRDRQVWEVRGALAGLGRAVSDAVRSLAERG